MQTSIAASQAYPVPEIFPLLHRQVKASLRDAGLDHWSDRQCSVEAVLAAIPLAPGARL
jgi:hypothetical protein